MGKAIPTTTVKEVKPKAAVVEADAPAPLFLGPPPSGCHAVAPAQSNISDSEFTDLLSKHDMESVRALFLQHVRVLRSIPRTKLPRPVRPASLPASVSARMKLLAFHENTRPPYWGTCSRRSSTVRSRKPLGRDTRLDYSVDSDDEWEEEEPGDDCVSEGSAAGESESEGEEEKDGFVVDDDYLSDNEGVDVDRMPSDTAGDEEGATPTKHRKKRAKTMVLTAASVGVCFQPVACDAIDLSQYTIQPLCSHPVDPFATRHTHSDTQDNTAVKAPHTFR